ncbi:hypothetical protein D3C75_928800 [compost metagenome]
MEVPAGDYALFIGKNQRIVCRRIHLNIKLLRDISQRIPACPVHLRHAAQRIGILYPLLPLVRHQGAAGRQIPDVAGRLLLAFMRPYGMRSRIKSIPHRQQRLAGQCRRAVRPVRQLQCIPAGQRTDRRHDLCSVNQSQPFFGLQYNRCESCLSQRLCPRQPYSPVIGLAFTDQDEHHMR